MRTEPKQATKRSNQAPAEGSYTVYLTRPALRRHQLYQHPAFIVCGLIPGYVAEADGRTHIDSRAVVLCKVMGFAVEFNDPSAVVYDYALVVLPDPGAAQNIGIEHARVILPVDYQPLCRCNVYGSLVA